MESTRSRPSKYAKIGLNPLAFIPHKLDYAIKYVLNQTKCYFLIQTQIIFS